MKKHPILTIFSVVFCFILIYGLLVFIDIYKIFKFIHGSEFSHSLRVKDITLKEMCELKKIKYDEKKQEIEESLDFLIKEKSNYILFSTYRFDLEVVLKELDCLNYNDSKKEYFLSIDANNQSLINNLNVLKQQIELFNKNFNVKEINDYSWNPHIKPESLEDNPMKNFTVYHSNELSELSMFFGILDLCANKEIYDDASVGFCIMLKTFLLNQYINKNMIGRIYKEKNLDALFIYFDKIMNNRYSELEMKKMLKDLKEINPLILDFTEYLKINYEFGINMYDFISYRFPYVSFTYKVICGDPKKELDNLYNLSKEKKFEEAYNKYLREASMSSIFVSPAFFQLEGHNKEYLIVKSRLSLIQAYLEEKLGEKVTAIDPYDGNPIRFTTDEKGQKIYYCLGPEGKDLKGKGNNIINCDSELKEELKKHIKSGSNQ